MNQISGLNKHQIKLQTPSCSNITGEYPEKIVFKHDTILNVDFYEKDDHHIQIGDVLFIEEPGNKGYYGTVFAVCPPRNDEGMIVTRLGIKRLY